MSSASEYQIDDSVSHFQKPFRKLAPEDQERIRKKLEEVSLDPYRLGEQVEGRHKRQVRKIRVGHYRIAYLISENPKKKIIPFELEAGHQYTHF